MAPTTPSPSPSEASVEAGREITVRQDTLIRIALGNITGQPTRVVVRQRDQESTVNLNVAMFGQVYHDRWPWIAPISIGIGIRGDSRATVYMGSALRFGPHASFTAGVAIGPVSALPAGIVPKRGMLVRAPLGARELIGVLWGKPQGGVADRRQ